MLIRGDGSHSTRMAAAAPPNRRPRSPGFPLWERWLAVRPRFPPLAVDGSLAVAMTGVTIWLGSAYHVAGFLDFDLQAVLLTCLASLPLALRRVAPLPVLLISCFAAVWFFHEQYMPGFNVFGPLLALYTVVALKSRRTALIGAVFTSLTIVASGMAAEGFSIPTAMAQSLMATAIAWVFGDGARRLADRNRLLVELTEQLRREREERARTAVVEERVRIARELHDVVAHHMSVISVHTGLAQYVLSSDRETVRDALETIAVTSHQALEEMRRMLAVLRAATAHERTEVGSEEPAPGVARVGDLVERMRVAGIPVEVTVTGEVVALPPGADLCVYRVVQESLTNVLKHAGFARTTVTLDYQPGTLVVRVIDDGPLSAPASAPAANPEAREPGHGLMGMRERACLYGGTLSAEPTADGGFAVTLTLPVPAAVEGAVTSAPGASSTRP
jgi:signal transduction histidine kinase